MTLLTEAVILGLFAMSLDLMFGYTRLVSFGHAAAYGFGAYACGWMLLHTGMPLLFAVFAAGLLTGVIAIGVGWMCTLATGVSFSMLTLAFAQLLYAISFKWTSVTGGSDGLAGIPRTRRPVRLRGAARARPASTIWRSPAWSAGSSMPARWCARRSARCCAAFARTKPRRRRWATTPASTRSPWWPSPTGWADWPAPSTRRSPASPTPSCCSGCCRARC